MFMSKAIIMTTMKEERERRVFLQLVTFLSTKYTMMTALYASSCNIHVIITIILIFMSLCRTASSSRTVKVKDECHVKRFGDDTLASHSFNIPLHSCKFATKKKIITQRIKIRLFKKYQHIGHRHTYKHKLFST